MTRVSLPPWTRWLALGGGLLDLGTGLGLVWQPVLTLRLMGSAIPGQEALVQLRFVGAFVTAVGVSYLLGLRAGGDDAFRAMLACTLRFRLAAGSYVAVACVLGWLGTAWISVAVTDLGLAAVQAVLLLKGVGRDA